MGRTKTRKHALLASHSHKNFSSGPRHIDVILPAKNPIDSPPQSSNRNSQQTEFYNPDVQSRKRKRFYISEVGHKRPRSVSSRLSSVSSEVDDLQQKWFFVVEYRSMCCPDLSIPSSLGKSIAHRAGVDLQTLKKWVLLASQTGDLTRKHGSGRPKFKFDIGSRCMREIYDEYGGVISQWAISELCKQKGVNIQKHTVQRILAGPNWAVVKSKLVPLHTKVHLQNRLLFASENISNHFGDAETLHIDIDEKYFYAYKTSYIVYVPSELQHVVKEFHEVHFSFHLSAIKVFVFRSQKLKFQMLCSLELSLDLIQRRDLMGVFF